jgi:hypothetical protein
VVGDRMANKSRTIECSFRSPRHIAAAQSGLLLTQRRRESPSLEASLDTMLDRIASLPR